MQRNRAAVVLIGAAILCGCNRSATVVYVDVNGILDHEKPPVSNEISVPSPPAPRPAVTETMPGAPAVALPDPATAPTQNVQTMFKAEQASALLELQRRLRQYYHGEVQGFQLLQERAISERERLAYEQADAKIRPLFEAWANERAPKYYRLTLIAGFPDPNPTSKPPDRPLTAGKQRLFDEAKQLRLQLKAMDARFDAESKAILDAVAERTKADQTVLKQRVNAFAAQLDRKAESEANAQIRQAVSQLKFRLANPTPVDLPATGTRQLTIPAEKPLEPAPRVPSGGILEGTSDRRQLLEHELRIWLALNRLTLSEERKGHRDVTEEFQKWRQQHGAGL